jgi:uncharacterized protein YggE
MSVFVRGAAGFLLVSVLALPFASVQAQDRPVWMVTVAGEAVVSVPPDLAEFRAGVTSQGKTARDASEANAKAMARVLAALREGGIEGADIQTSRISLQPVHEGSRGSAGRITAFQASNQVTVKIRDIDKVSEMIDRVVGAGANEVGGIDFLVSAPSTILDAARPEAFADAKRKAEIYARAAGLGLGRAAAISEEGFQSPVGLRPSPRAAFSMPVAPGHETLRVSVIVSFELLR